MRRPILTVQRLETRAVPASVAFTGGNLRILGTTGVDTILVSETAGNVSVKVGTTSFGTYRVTGNIAIDSGNGNDAVTVTVNTGLQGRLDIAAGFGNDNVQLLGTGASGIQGATAINLGLGNDQATVGNQLRLSNLTVTGDLGTDRLNFDSGIIAGNLITNGVNDVQVGTFGGFPGGPATVGGSVIDNASTEGVPSSFYLVGGSSIGVLTYLGSSGGSDVQIGEGVPSRPGFTDGQGSFGGSIRGAASILGGNGSNRFAIYGGDILGSVHVQGGNFNDLFEVRDFAGIAGSLTMNVGNGNNTFIAEPGALFVAGNYAVSGGNGNDILTSSFNRGIPILGYAPEVAGSFSVNLGNGDNTFDFGGTVGGKLSYTGGGGGDRVDLRSGPISRVDIHLGAGDDFLRLHAGFATNSGVFDFGYGDDTYDDAGIVFGNNMTILNLP